MRYSKSGGGKPPPKNEDSRNFLRDLQFLDLKVFKVAFSSFFSDMKASYQALIKIQ